MATTLERRQEDGHQGSAARRPARRLGSSGERDNERWRCPARRPRQAGEKIKLPGIDVAAIVESQRKDMEALAEANRQAYEGIKALAQRRNEILQEALVEWQEAMKDATGKDALSQERRAGEGRVSAGHRQLPELAEMEAKSRSKAWKVVQDRFQENLANLQKLLSRSEVAPQARGARSKETDHGDKVPRSKENDYTRDMAEARRRFVTERTGTALEHVGSFSFDPGCCRATSRTSWASRRCRSASPGRCASTASTRKGDFFVPMATSEGTLVASYNRGMRLLSESGGVKTTVVEQFMQRSPVFILDDALEGARVRRLGQASTSTRSRRSPRRRRAPAS